VESHEQGRVRSLPGFPTRTDRRRLRRAASVPNRPPLRRARDHSWATRAALPDVLGPPIVIGDRIHTEADDLAVALLELGLQAFASGPKSVWFCGVLGPYRCPVMTFRILARSNIKASMTFFIAEPPLRRADQQRCQGDPAHTNAPARNLHRWS